MAELTPALHFAHSSIPSWNSTPWTHKHGPSILQSGLNWNPVPTATPSRPHSKTTAPSRHPDTPHNPLARWHLLSLDAPTVAAVWVWFVAASNQIHLPLVSALAMALAVWT